MTIFKIKKNLNFNIFKLYYFLPLLLVTGPFLPDLLVSLSSIFFLIYFGFNEKELFKMQWVCFFLLFYFILIFTSIFSIFSFVSLKSSLPYLRFLMLVLSTYYLLEKKVLKLNIYYLCLATLIIILSLDGFMQFITGKNILGFVSPISYRVNSFFHDKAVFGSFIFKLIPLFFFLHLVSDNFKYKNFLFKISLLFSIFAITISGDRSAFYMLIIYITLTTLFFLNKKNLVTSLLVFSIIFLIIYKNDVLKNRILLMTYEGFFNVLDKFDEIKIKKKIILENKQIKNINFYISDDHHNHMLTAIKIFKEYPLLGSGPNTYRVVCKDQRFYLKPNSCTTHPHNFYLQTLSETGLFGFIFLFFLFLKTSHFLVFKCLFLPNKKIEYFIYFNFFAILFPLLPNGNLLNNWLSILNFLPFGFYLYYFQNKNHFESK